MNQTESLQHFAAFCGLDRDDRLNSFGAELCKEGFTAVRRFLDDFRTYLRSYEDHQSEEASRLVARGRAALPEPKRISPSWADIWEEYAGIVKVKNSVLHQIPAGRRDGEWQVLLDNPYTNQNIVVYPAMTFLESAYLYAYFRIGLTENEYIRLQKVDTVISESGRDF
ncbi:hypothetical protein AB6A23_14105 [Paenibacillus tarimensis]